MIIINTNLGNSYLQPLQSAYFQRLRVVDQQEQLRRLGLFADHQSELQSKRCTNRD